MNQDLKIETLALLKQFGQVILSGPPGTGKTRAALNVAESILGDLDAEKSKDKPRFAFVQFHPSYNYEDFVRGIRVETDDGNNVVYKTENRIFGEMAERAAASDDPHVLVIDEINRANVSAVLGELIYGLEYRGKEVQTPYKVNGKKKGNKGGKGEGNATFCRRLCQRSGDKREDKGEGNAGLVIPKNLQIIGTMNTADRTIGQIDYAVRRRFAFVHCPPQRSVLKNETAETFFDLVDGVFEYLSADYDKEDVCIGHSYFLADFESKLARKIIYQVVPILREYLKDGVLGKEARLKIDVIEEKARALSKGKEDKLKWFWVHMDSGSVIAPISLRRSILLMVRHYAKTNKCQNVEQLRQAFPNSLRPGMLVVASVDDKIIREDERKYPSPADSRFFRYEQQKIRLENDVVVVCGEWGARKGEEDNFNKFKIHASQLGYKIYCVDKITTQLSFWYVNVGHVINCPHRAWEKCRQYGFMSCGQDKDINASRSSVKQLQNIPLGAIVFAYRDSFGYVGCGVVTQTAIPIREFISPHLEEQPSMDPDDPDWEALSREIESQVPDDQGHKFKPEKEFAIGVDWLPGRDHSDGILMKHHGRGTAHSLDPSDRLDALKREFGIVDEQDDTVDN